MYMRVEYLVLLDRISYLSLALPKLPNAFGLTASKSWYQHYFNTQAYLVYVGKITDISYYGEDEMSANESREFLASYEG